MVFFRSEELAKTWCKSNGHPLRPLVPVKQLWDLADVWYRTRLQPDARRPEPHEVFGVFRSVGLTDEFWNPQSETYG